MIVQIDTAALDKVTACIIHGLITDGAHHKQWDLEEALQKLCGDEFVQKAKAEFQWTEGIPS